MTTTKWLARAVGSLAVTMATAAAADWARGPNPFELPRPQVQQSELVARR